MIFSSRVEFISELLKELGSRSGASSTAERTSSRSVACSTEKLSEVVSDCLLIPVASFPASSPSAMPRIFLRSASSRARLVVSASGATPLHNAGSASPDHKQAVFMNRNSCNPPPELCDSSVSVLVSGSDTDACNKGRQIPSHALKPQTLPESESVVLLLPPDTSPSNALTSDDKNPTFANRACITAHSTGCVLCWASGLFSLAIREKQLASLCNACQVTSPGKPPPAMRLQVS